MQINRTIKFIEGVNPSLIKLDLFYDWDLNIRFEQNTLITMDDRIVDRENNNFGSIFDTDNDMYRISKVPRLCVKYCSQDNVIHDIRAKVTGLYGKVRLYEYIEPFLLKVFDIKTDLAFKAGKDYVINFVDLQNQFIEALKKARVCEFAGQPLIKTLMEMYPYGIYKTRLMLIFSTFVLPEAEICLGDLLNEDYTFKCHICSFKGPALIRYNDCIGNVSTQTIYKEREDSTVIRFNDIRTFTKPFWNLTHESNLCVKFDQNKIFLHHMVTEHEHPHYRVIEQLDIPKYLLYVAVKVSFNRARRKTKQSEVYKFLYPVWYTIPTYIELLNMDDKSYRMVKLFALVIDQENFSVPYEDLVDYDNADLVLYNWSDRLNVSTACIYSILYDFAVAAMKYGCECKVCKGGCCEPCSKIMMGRYNQFSKMEKRNGIVEYPDILQESDAMVLNANDEYYTRDELKGVIQTAKVSHINLIAMQLYVGEKDRYLIGSIDDDYEILMVISGWVFIKSKVYDDGGNMFLSKYLSKYINTCKGVFSRILNYYGIDIDVELFKQNRNAKYYKKNAKLIDGGSRFNERIEYIIDKVKEKCNYDIKVLIVSSMIKGVTRGVKKGIEYICCNFQMYLDRLEINVVVFDHTLPMTMNYLEYLAAIPSYYAVFNFKYSLSLDENENACRIMERYAIMTSINSTWIPSFDNTRTISTYFKSVQYEACDSYNRGRMLEEVIEYLV